MHLAAPGEPHLHVRADEPHHGEDAQRPLRGQVPLAGQRRPLEGDQEVHRHRVRVQFAQREDHVDQVLVALAHPRDQPRTGRKTRALRPLDGVHPVRVGVGGGDLPVGRLGGVQVVVVRVGARRAQPLRLTLRQQPEAGADLDVLVVRLDRLDGLRDPVDVPVGRAPAARHQADPLRAAREPRCRRLGRLLGTQPGVLEDARRGAEPLRAVRAILGAEPGLEVDQVVQLHPAAEPLAAHPARRRHHVQQVVVGGGEHRQRLVTGRQLTPKPLVHQRLQEIHAADPDARDGPGPRRLPTTPPESAVGITTPCPRFRPASVCALLTNGGPAALPRRR